MRPFPDLQPGDSVRVNLDQQKERKKSEKDIARIELEAEKPYSLVICHPDTLESGFLKPQIPADCHHSSQLQDLDLDPAMRAKEPRSVRVLAYRIRSPAE